MEHFPSEICAKSIKQSLGDTKNKYVASLLRSHIYRHLILRRNDNEFVDLEKFTREDLELDATYLRSEIPKIVALISCELAEIGWKSGLSYNDTGLFIYAGDKPPSCW
jgi:hypothetical protein